MLCYVMAVLHLALDEVDHWLVVDEVNVLEADLLVRVHRLFLLKSVPSKEKKKRIEEWVGVLL